MSWKEFIITNAIFLGARKVIVKYADNLVDKYGIEKTYTIGMDGFDQDLDENDKKILVTMGASLLTSSAFALYNLVTGVRAITKKDWLLALAAIALPFTRADFKLDNNEDYSELSVDVDKDTFIANN